MAGIAVYAEKFMLDYVLLGATATRPTLWSVGVSLGAPSSISASEIATGSGATRQPVTFLGATTPAGSPAIGSNSAAMTFGPFSAGCTVSAVQLWDTTTVTGGNMLWFGALATARTLGAGDSLIIPAGGLSITLS